MRRVILESPYGNENKKVIEENVRYARLCVHDCVVNHGDSPQVSHLLFTQPGILNDAIPEERTLGIEAGLAWGCVAEATVVYTDRGISKGMHYGIENAEKAGRPIEYRSLAEYCAVDILEKNQTTECTFCDRSQFEERLVAEIDGYYVIATLGQITDGGYVLLVPVKHMPCMGALTWGRDGETDSMLRTSFKVSAALSREYGQGSTSWPSPVTVFEHGIVGQTIKHAHLHFLPTALDLTPRIRTDFPDAEIVELRYGTEFQKLYSERLRPYLYWTRPDGKAMICFDPPAPAQYFRTVVAEMLGRPERANWRTMDQELDKRLWTETIRRLKPHFA